MTLTKSWLQKQITDLEATRDEIPFGLTGKESKTLAAFKLALASLEAGESVKSAGFIEGKADGADRYIFKAYYGQSVEVGGKLYTAPSAPGAPDGLRLALSNAGIASPESDEMLAATCEKYIQELVTWVKDRKPFRPAQVSVPDERYQHLSELYHVQEKRLFKLAQRIKGPSFDKYAHSPSQAIDVLESALFGESDDTCRAAMLQGADGNSPQSPESWVACSERMPGEVLAALQNIARLRRNLNDFCGDKSLIAKCLSEAEGALLNAVNRHSTMLAEPLKEAKNV